jgi:prepilin-type N-terminal cleavage/methylation domain-containing protein
MWLHLLTITEKKRKGKSSKGFTLMEVLVAVAILGLAYVAVLQNFSVSLGNITRLSGHRDRLLHTTLVLEKEMLLSESGNENPIFLEGSRYRLVIVTSADEKFTTLKLAKL